MLSRRATLFYLPLLAAPPLALTWAQNQSIGLVEEIDGGVQATNGGRARALALGADILLGDRLRSDGRGGCAIRFNDDTLFDIGAGSDVVIDGFVYAGGSSLFSAQVVVGGFRFLTGQIAALSPSRFMVATPAGVIGVRGTHVAGSVDGETLEAMLLESDDEDAGAAFLRNDAGETALSEPGALRRWRGRGAIAERLSALTPDQRAAFLERFGMGGRLRRFQADRNALRQALSRLSPAQRRRVLDRLRDARARIRGLPADQRPAALRRLRETLRERLDEAAAAGEGDQPFRQRREERLRERRERRDGR